MTNLASLTNGESPLPDSNFTFINEDGHLQVKNLELGILIRNIQLIQEQNNKLYIKITLERNDCNDKPLKQAVRLLTQGTLTKSIPDAIWRDNNFVNEANTISIPIIGAELEQCHQEIETVLDSIIKLGGELNNILKNANESEYGVEMAARKAREVQEK
jgi:hypothetical protein